MKILGENLAVDLSEIRAVRYNGLNTKSEKLYIIIFKDGSTIPLNYREKDNLFKLIREEDD